MIAVIVSAQENRRILVLLFPFFVECYSQETKSSHSRLSNLFSWNLMVEGSR